MAILMTSTPSSIKDRVARLELPEGMGVILRTNALDQPQKTLNRDLNALLRLWKKIRKEATVGKGPRLLYSDQDLIVQALRGEPITVYGDGNQTRSFCFVDDLVELLFPHLSGESEYFAPAEIDGRLRCEFADVSERLRKQHACEQAADEAVLLAESLTQARRDGYRIDWQALAGGGSISGGDFTLRVTAAGDYLHLPIVYLARVPHDDWQAVARWLRARLQQQPGMLVIQHGEELVDDSNRG